MLGDNCFLFGCVSCRRAKGIGIWKLPTPLNDDFRKWGEAWLNELTKYRVIDKDFQNQIDNDKVFTCEKHFKPEDIEIYKRTTGLSKKDPERLSKKIEEVREPLGRRLNIEGEKLTAFDKENEQFNLKAYKILLHWKQKEDSAATFEVMYNALCHQIVN